MSQTISRMYASHDQALKVAHDLRTHRLDRFESVHVVSRDDDPNAGADAIAASIMKGYVLKSHAKVYAEGIRRGGALVTVHAPFGTAVAAMQILDQHGPIDAGVAEPEDRLPAWDDATPVSSALRIPVLLPDNATFARFWNIPALAKRPRTSSEALGIRELSQSSGAFTGTFGMALLSNKATPLSSMFGLPVLKK